MTDYILLVDDEQPNLELFTVMFRTLGQRAEGVTLGAEAIEKVRASRPIMVLVDAVLPDMSGFEVCAAIKKIADIPVAMLTARTDESAREQARQAGADEFLVKPVSRAQLQDFLNRALKKE